MVRQILIGALILALASCKSLPNDPAPPTTIGIVDSARGSPALVRKNQEYIVGARSRIYEGDVVRTDRFSTARIHMADGSRIEIGRETRVVINRYTRGSTRLTLTAGTIRAAAETAQRFELQTPVATVDARDATVITTFSSARNTLEAGLLNGSRLEVSNIHGATLIEAPGNGTTVMSGTAPQAFRPWTPGKIERAFAEIELSQ